MTAILFGDTAEAMLADAERTVARGIRALKVKLWRHSIDDINLVRDIRSAVGDDVLIYADANHSYTEDEARTLLPQLAEYGVTLIEDPCNVSAERARGAGARVADADPRRNPDRLSRRRRTLLRNATRPAL